MPKPVAVHIGGGGGAVVLVYVSCLAVLCYLLHYLSRATSVIVCHSPFASHRIPCAKSRAVYARTQHTRTTLTRGEQGVDLETRKRDWLEIWKKGPLERYLLAGCVCALKECGV